MTYLEKVKFSKDVRNHRMKWGVRRFQNDDGILTEEAKKRYMKEETVAKINSNIEVLANALKANEQLYEPRELKDWQWEIMLKNETESENQE